jgi:type IV secretory pathway VirB2 component (pilin)
MLRLDHVGIRIGAAPMAIVAAVLGVPNLATAQSSPFLTGATALQTNIIGWLTPIAVILIMVLGGMAMANRMSWGWCMGAILGIAIAFGAPQIIVENCGNTLILRCSGSEGGGTSHFASRLIGEREIVRRQVTHGRDREGLFGTRGSRRSTQVSDQHVTEVALMPSELEQLPDLTGYLKTASTLAWARVSIAR